MPRNQSEQTPSERDLVTAFIKAAADFDINYGHGAPMRRAWEELPRPVRLRVLHKTSRRTYTSYAKLLASDYEIPYAP